MNAQERLESGYIPEPNSGCWLWTGSLSAGGYGRITIWNPTTQGAEHFVAHRVSYEMHKGLIPLGLQIDHLCRVKCCVNPAHLEAVSARENVLRSFKFTINSVRSKRRTHCPQGHLYSDENTRMQFGRSHETGKGYWNRICRTCGKEREARNSAQEALEKSQIGIPLGKQGAAKITEVEVREIRRLRATGLQYKVIAAQFAIGRRAVGDICTRVKWKHVL